MLTNKKWWKAALVRAAKTVAQAALAMIPAAVTITQVEWPVVLGTAALAGVVSLLTSLAGLPEVDDRTVPEADKRTVPEADKRGLSLHENVEEEDDA